MSQETRGAKPAPRAGIWPLRIFCEAKPASRRGDLSLKIFCAAVVTQAACMECCYLYVNEPSFIEGYGESLWVATCFVLAGSFLANVAGCVLGIWGCARDGVGAKSAAIWGLVLNVLVPGPMFIAFMAIAMSHFHFEAGSF